MKKCNCCGQELPLYCFHRDVAAKDGLRPRCRSCRNEVKREQERRAVRIKSPESADYSARKEEIRKYRKENKFIQDWNLRAPWEKTYSYIRDRCGTGRDPAYVDVKCNITIPELKLLWYRDKAYNLTRPSIDRKDSEGDYTFDNCRYIELSVNIKRARVEDLKKGKLHWGENGKFVS